LIAGGNATASVTLKNEGNSVGETKVLLQVPKNWKYEPLHAQLTLNPGEEQTAKFVVLIPEDVNGDAKIISTAIYDSENGTNVVSKELTKPVFVSTNIQIMNYFRHIFAQN
jgi:hypothetical protein